jgi:hypothetical protein
LGLTAWLLAGYQKSVPAQRPTGREPAPAFEEFQATVLYCNRCRAPQAVRERLLLYLADGELWEYLCQVCGASLGSRRTTGVAPRRA